MSQTKIKCLKLKCLKLLKNVSNKKMSQTKKNVSNYQKMSQTILLLYFEAMYEEPSLSSETMIISMPHVCCLFLTLTLLLFHFILAIGNEFAPFHFLMNMFPSQKRVFYPHKILFEIHRFFGFFCFRILIFTDFIQSPIIFFWQRDLANPRPATDFPSLAP
jgi:hypothetical protein